MAKRRQWLWRLVQSPFIFVLFILRHSGWILEFLLGSLLVYSFLTSPDPFFVRLARAALAGARSAWALLQVDTFGTLAALGFTLVKMMPGVAVVLVLATRLRGWERLRLPLWALLLPWIGPLACLVPWTPFRMAVLTILAALAIWLTKYRSLRWTALLPLAMYLDIFMLHLLSHPPLHVSLPSLLTASIRERCRENDGQRPLNLRDSQVGPHYVSVTPLNKDEVLLTNAGGWLPFWEVSGGTPDDFSSWWLRRQGEGWIFDAGSRVTGDMQNGCLMDDEMWLNDADRSFVVGVKRDSTGQESLRVIEMHVNVNNMALPVCRPERGTVIVSEVISGTRMWEVSVATGEVRQMGTEAVGLHWAPRLHDRDHLTINDTSDLMVYSLQDETVSQRIAAGVFMLDRHERCPLNGEVATADMTGRVRLFRLLPDGRYELDWGISLPAPRNVAFSPDCRFLGVTSTDDRTVSLVDLGTRKVVATYHAGPVLREITFLGERELAVTDACTLTTFRF